MTLPASYTETTLVQYMLRVLGELATVLGMDEAALAEAANDVALACGVADVALVMDVAKVRALATVSALRAARRAAAWYDFDADGGGFKRSQVQAQVGSLLAAAEREAMVYDGGYAVAAGAVRYVADPYRWGADTAAAEGAG